MHSFFVDAIAAGGELQELAARERDHLFKTLRARPGEAVELLDGRGGCAGAVVEENRRLRVTGVRREPAPANRLHLFCAVPRKAKFDVLLKQAAELGVATLQPMICERSVAQPEGSDRWTTLLQEGCKQSKNPFLPEILPPLKFPAALRALEERCLTGYFGAVDSTQPGLGGGPVFNPAWLVGPEGGFTEAEEQAMRSAGVHPLNLGPWVLRLETAAVCGLAVLRQRMAVLLVSAAALLLFGAGCSDRGTEAAKHPLMLKGNEYREKGDGALAEKFYWRFLSSRPEDPAGYLALATLYDETLQRPEAALYFYDEYLKLAPPGTPDREAVGLYRDQVRAKLREALQLETLPQTELEALRLQNAGIREDLRRAKQLLAALSARRAPRAPAAAPAAPPEQPTESPAPAPADPGAPRRYVVKAGDTPGKIARRFYGSAAKYPLILEANQLKSATGLRIGQELLIPPVPPER